MAEQSLKEKTVKGTFWSAADAFLGQGVTFIVGIVLARLLSPEEYGIIGICLIFNTILNGIVDSGFSNALIRKKNVSSEEYNTMFLTNLAISVVLYLLLFLSTPLIATFFDRVELISLIRVTGLVLFFNALSLTHATILTKRIDFKTKTKASVYSAVLSGVFGITMAFLGFGVWSLVSQMLSKQLIYTLTLWIFIKWWPTLSFSKKAFSYMWGFGWKLLVSGLLSNLWNQLYQVVVGKYYLPATLGQYTRAKEYANLFSTNLTTIIQRVSYPVLSNLQDSTAQMVNAYRRIIKTTMYITCSCMLFLAAVSEPLIRFLIGDKWMEAATYLPLICISMSLYPLHALNLNLLQVLGRSDIFLKIEILKKIIGLLPIFVGVFINIYWMLIASIITGVINYFINSHYTGRKLGYSSFKQLLDVAPNYFIAGAAAFVIYFLKFIQMPLFVVLLCQIVLGLIILICLTKLFDNQQLLEIKMILNDFKLKKR